MSHKIKFNLNKQQNKKSLEEQPNEKISISISSSKENKNKSEIFEKKITKTKEKLVNDDLNKIIENPIKVKIENWLINNKKISSYIIDKVISNLNERKINHKNFRFCVN